MVANVHWCKFPFMQIAIRAMIYSGKYSLGNCIWWQMSIGATFHSCKFTSCKLMTAFCWRAIIRIPKVSSKKFHNFKIQQAQGDGEATLGDKNLLPYITITTDEGK